MRRWAVLCFLHLMEDIHQTPCGLWILLRHRQCGRRDLTSLNIFKKGRNTYMPMRMCLYLMATSAAFFLVSCDYGHKQYRPSDAVTLSPTTPLVIEVDDFGRFWDRDAAAATLQTISTASVKKNILVLVFIHGWHHNADETDDNFNNFQQSLEYVRAKLAKPEYVKARELLNLKDDIHVIGLYVGWRGRALPGWLDYVTFWGRKSAAERVGDGDLREFLVRLQSIYMDRNDPSQKDTFMGLLTIGHSFGGQVLFKAVSEAFENDLTKAVARLGDHPTKTTAQLPEIVSGLGDTTVLLNPALEAFQFERIDRLTYQTSFNEFQPPVFVTISAEDDSARKFWFPIARNINMLFRATFQNDEVKKLWATALGVYEPQQTHTLEATDRLSSLSDFLYKGCAIENVDLTDALVLSGALLSPNAKRKQPYSPVVVAYTSNKLVQEHSGIFGDTFSDFLTDYVAFIQGKRMCLIRGRGPATAN